MSRRLFFALSLSILCFIGCQKDFTPSPSTTSGIVITASTDSDTAVRAGSRVGFEDNTDGTTEGKISLTWQSGGGKVDSFSVYDKTGSYVGRFHYVGVDGATSGDFKQDGIFSMSADAQYTAVIPAVEAHNGVYPTLAERDAALTTQQQVIYSLDDLSYLDGVMRLRSEFTYDLKGTHIAFEHEVSILKCNVSLPESRYPKVIEVADGASQYEIHVPYSLASNSVSFYIAVEPAAADYSRDIDLYVTDQDGAEYADSKSTLEPFEAGVIRHATISLEEQNQIYIDYTTTGVTINGVSYDLSTATHVTTSSVLPKEGVILLDPESDDTIFTLAAGVYSNVVIVGRYSHKKPKVECSGVQYLGKDGDVVYKNIDLTGFSGGNYTYNFASAMTSPLNSWVVEDCVITTVADKAFSYFKNNSSSASIKSIVWHNNRVNVVTTKDRFTVNLINLTECDAAAIERVSFTNNTFYSASDFYINSPIISVNPVVESNMRVTFKSNTLVNFISTNAIIYLPDAESIDVDKNIFWGSTSVADNFNLLRITRDGATPAISLGDNIAYGGKYWRHYNSGTKYPTDAPNSVFGKVASDPFATMRKESGTFLPKYEYKKYGALY